MKVQQLARIDPAIAARVGVLLFDESDDVNTLMAASVAALRARNVVVAGLLQRFGDRLPSGKRAMWLDDVATGQVIRLDQPRGPGAGSCTLDNSALAEAGCLLRKAASSGAQVIVVPRFGSVEAEGGGLRVEIAEAVLSGAVVIIAVRPSNLADLEQFLGGPGTVLLPSAAAIAGWAARSAGVAVADAAA
ncbi:MAG: DUF2478 domain-containing protein [Acetobacteraceae bacterium]|nr:DUF2478 domain-containing protein [Pseudomonadota bacterium]